MSDNQVILVLLAILVCLFVFIVLLLFQVWKQSKSIAELRELSTTDPLTGLNNRRAFDEALIRSLSLLPTGPEDKRSCRTKKGHGLLMVDIDHFKNVNDTYGHQFGDVVLKAVARNLTTHVRATDLVARLGGEEFMISVPDVTADELEHVAEKLRDGISKVEFVIDDDTTSVTVSVGSMHTSSYLDSNSLAGVVDKALYEAKKRGRNKVIAYRLD